MERSKRSRWIAFFIAPSQKFSTRFVKTFWEEKLRILIIEGRIIMGDAFVLLAGGLGWGGVGWVGLGGEVDLLYNILYYTILLWSPPCKQAISQSCSATCRFSTPARVRNRNYCCTAVLSSSYMLTRFIANFSNSVIPNNLKSTKLLFSIQKQKIRSNLKRSS